jgi:hypothetical protein
LSYNSTVVSPELGSHLPREDFECPLSLDELSLPQTDREIDRKAALAIEKFLGVKPSRVLVFFRMGHHKLTEAYLRIIEKLRINHLALELGPGQMSELENALRLASQDSPQQAGQDEKQAGEEKNVTRRQLLQGVWERFRYLGQGDPEEQVSYHRQLLGELLKRGVTVSLTDADARAVRKEENLPVDFVFYIVLVYLMLSAATSADAFSAAAKATREKKFPRSIFLLWSGRGILSAAYLSIFGRIYAAAKPLPSYPTNRIPVVEEAVDLQVLLEGLVDKRRGHQPTMGTFSEVLNYHRNLIMTLNLWHLVALESSLVSGQSRILAMAAPTHGKVEDLFLEGPEYLEAEVRKLAEMLLSTGLDSLISRHNGNYNDIVNALHDWGKFFTKPLRVGTTQRTQRALTACRVPASAQTVFVEALLKEFGKQKNRSGRNDSPSKKFRLAVLRNVVKKVVDDGIGLSANRDAKFNELTGVSQTSQSLSDISGESPIIYSDLWSKISGALISFARDKRAKSSRQEIVHSVDRPARGNQIAISDVGIVRINGSYYQIHRVARPLGADPSRLELLDFVGLETGEVVILERKTYVLPGSIDNTGREAGSGRPDLGHQDLQYKLRILTKNDGKTITTYGTVDGREEQDWGKLQYVKEGDGSQVIQRLEEELEGESGATSQPGMEKMTSELPFPDLIIVNALQPIFAA